MRVNYIICFWVSLISVFAATMYKIITRDWEVALLPTNNNLIIITTTKPKKSKQTSLLILLLHGWIIFCSFWWLHIYFFSLSTWDRICGNFFDTCLWCRSIPAIAETSSSTCNHPHHTCPAFVEEHLRSAHVRGFLSREALPTGDVPTISRPWAKNKNKNIFN